MLPIIPIDKIREWDNYTIKNEPVLSTDLMERAASVFTDWLLEKYNLAYEKILIICSKGNNGGDGLVTARKLIDLSYDVDVIVADIQSHSTPDFEINLQRLKEKRIVIKVLQVNDPLPDLSQFTMIIDAIFGYGLDRPLIGYWSQFIQHINNSHSKIISIDIPSGMFADKLTEGIVIKSADCLTFEVPKLSFFFPENEDFIPLWSVRSIGLTEGFRSQLVIDTYCTEISDIKERIKKRIKFGHKGDYGHALIIGGSKEMTGAPILASKSCLRTGSGLVTSLVPQSALNAIQCFIPEVMNLCGYGIDHISALPPLEKYNSIAIGMGLGTHDETCSVIEELLEKVKVPLLIDADALNLISSKPFLISKIPKGTIITPHPGEFTRFFGATSDSLMRINLMRKKAVELGIFIVLKGHYTSIATPEGHIYFNTTGNPGMATAGCGDVLSGMIASLLAQGYSIEDACIIGVHLHGLAGDISLQSSHEQSLIASDIIDNIAGAYRMITND